MPIPGTVQLAGKIAPTALTDTYPTHDSNYGRGGIHHVTTIAERDAITTQRRVAGMLATIVGDTNIYRLEADLTTWSIVSGGGGTSSPIPQHGTTAQRVALGNTFGPVQSGFPFYDTDIAALFLWNNDHWETAVIMGFGPRIREYVGTPAQILPLFYQQADRWTNTASPSLCVYVCKTGINTHTMADWVPLGKQGA